MSNTMAHTMPNTMPDDQPRRTRSMSAATEKARLAELLWPQLSGDLITRLVEVAPASVLPMLALLESRACMPASARLTSLLQLWQAQGHGHINHMCEPFELLELMGNGDPGEWFNRRLSVFQASEPQGLAVLAAGLSAGAFPFAKQLDILYTNLSGASLSLLIPPLRQGALPLLEEICIEGNFAGDAFMVDLSDAVAEGALRALRKLNLSRNYIGNAGVKAFATAITHDGALPHLQMLQLRTQGSIFAPLGDAGANDLAVALDSRRSLPSLSALLLTEPGIDNPKLKATCEARGIDLHNGSAK